MRRAFASAGDSESVAAPRGRASVTTDRLDSLLEQPHARTALADLIEAQLLLDRSASGPPLAEVAGDALVVVISCARRVQEQRETDLPASRCAWAPDQAIGGWRCQVCRRAEVDTVLARRLDGFREGG